MQARRIAAILVLLGLLTGLGDYPFVDEFFAAQHDCAAFADGAGHAPMDHQRHTTERVALCYAAFASAMASSYTVVEFAPTQATQVADEHIQLVVQRTGDRIERPPARAVVA